MHQGAGAVMTRTPGYAPTQNLAAGAAEKHSSSSSAIDNC